MIFLRVTSCPSWLSFSNRTHDLNAKLPLLPLDHLLSFTVVRMIWWFLILGCSTLVVVCVAIALYMRLRRHLQAAHAAREGTSSEAEHEHQSGDIEH